MNTSRVASRSVRALRNQPLRYRQVARRQYASEASGQSQASGQSHSSSALAGGLAGGAIAVGLGYGWYHFSGVKTAVNAAHQASSYLQSGKDKLTQAAPEPNQALDWLRQQSSFYASFVPGGKDYVDSAFKDLDTVRENHGDQVDKIVQQAYNDLKGVANKGLSVQTANEAWQVLEKHLKAVGDLASDAAKEIVKNHPELEEKIGGSVDQLRSLGKSLGPEANKTVQDTFSQVKDIVVGGGLSAASIKKVQDLIQQKIEEVKKFGDKAWEKGLSEAKPFLDKNPKVKELLNTNKSQLLSGNVGELWSKVKDATQSGKTDELEKYVKQTVDKAKDTAKDKGSKAGGDFQGMAESFLNQVLPAGGAGLSAQFLQIKDIASKTDSKEVEKLIKDTVAEVKDVLEKKIQEGKKLLEKKKD